MHAHVHVCTYTSIINDWFFDGWRDIIDLLMTKTKETGRTVRSFSNRKTLSSSVSPAHVYNACSTYNLVITWFTAHHQLPECRWPGREDWSERSDLKCSVQQTVNVQLEALWICMWHITTAAHTFIFIYKWYYTYTHVSIICMHIVIIIRNLIFIYHTCKYTVYADVLISILKTFDLTTL